MKIRKGTITAIHGPMFSGKTEELLRRIRRAQIAGKKTLLFKPVSDDRYSADKVIPHYLARNTAEKFGENAVSVSDCRDIASFLRTDINLVGIEEGQFFTSDLIETTRELSDRGISVVISLLDQDFRREPFRFSDGEEHTGALLAIAHESAKLTAICVRCGREAQHSQKLVLSGEYPDGSPIYVPASFHEDIILVGTARAYLDTVKHPARIYEARCLDCHELPDRPRTGDSSPAKETSVGQED